MHPFTITRVTRDPGHLEVKRSRWPSRLRRDRKSTIILGIGKPTNFKHDTGMEYDYEDPQGHIVVAAQLDDTAVCRAGNGS